MLNHYTLLIVLSLGCVVSILGVTDEDDGQDAVNCRPQHVHLSLGEAPDQVTVVWATEGACSGPLPVVTFGSAQWSLTERAEGKSESFAQNPKGLQNLHRVTLKGLKGETTYFYRPISNNVGSGPYYFKSLATGMEWSPEMLVVGDLGARSELLPVLGRVALSGDFSAALQLGGLSRYFSEINSTKGDRLMQGLEQVAAFIPYMTALGENETTEDYSMYLNYRYRFSMPGSIWPIPDDKLWYSFNMGPVHFVSYSTDVYLRGNTQLQQKQSNWLEMDLTEANQVRDKRPWIVAYGLHPLYCSGPDATDCFKKDSNVRAGLEDKLYYFGVDIILQSNAGGGYERLFPTFKDVVLATNYTNPRAPVQIVLGTASSTRVTFPFLPGSEPVNKTAGDSVNGSSLDDREMTTATSTLSSGVPGDFDVIAVASHTTSSGKREIKDMEKFAFKLVNGSHTTYGRLHIVNATHAHWELLAGSAFTGDNGGNVGVGDVLDSLWIVQERHDKFHLDSLPQDVEKKINQNMVESGGILVADTYNRVIIGASFGGFVVLLVLAGLVVRLARRKSARRVARRWDSMDYKYGKTKLYNPGHDDDLDHDDFKDDDDNDFEVDVSATGGQGQTIKLINGK